jgi:hypothetical protein
MQNIPIIAYHAKNDKVGWHEVLRESADWIGWNTADRSMINHLILSGEFVVTLGWNMYEVVREKVSV